MVLVQRGMRALRNAYRPDGFNVGVNEGRVAGAGVPDHLHVHVVPRWNGDTNFMPVLANTKVLPEALDQTWARLRRHFTSYHVPRTTHHAPRTTYHAAARRSTAPARGKEQAT